VADQSEARFYDLEGVNSRLRAAGQLSDPDPASHNAENAPAPHAAGTEPRPRKDAAMRFARQIGAELEVARRSGSFDCIVLVAGPAFIGLLRSALPEGVRATLIAEVRKDLLGQDESILQAYVPPEAFR